MQSKRKSGASRQKYGNYIRSRPLWTRFFERENVKNRRYRQKRDPEKPVGLAEKEQSRDNAGKVERKRAQKTRGKYYRRAENFRLPQVTWTPS